MLHGSAIKQLPIWESSTRQDILEYIDDKLVWIVVVTINMLQLRGRCLDYIFFNS